MPQHKYRPQSPLRTDIRNFLGTSTSQGREEFNNLKETIRQEYSQLQNLCEQNRLEADLYVELDAVTQPSQTGTAQALPNQNNPLYQALKGLAVERDAHWHFSPQNAAPRFTGDRVALPIPNQTVVYQPNTAIENNYESFVKISVLTQNLMWNSESLVIMGQEISDSLGNATIEQESETFTTVDYYWYNALR